MARRKTDTEMLMRLCRLAAHPRMSVRELQSWLVLRISWSRNGHLNRREQAILSKMEKKFPVLSEKKEEVAPQPKAEEPKAVEPKAEEPKPRKRPGPKPGTKYKRRTPKSEEA